MYTLYKQCVSCSHVPASLNLGLLNPCFQPLTPPHLPAFQYDNDKSCGSEGLGTMHGYSFVQNMLCLCGIYVP